MSSQEQESIQGQLIRLIGFALDRLYDGPARDYPTAEHIDHIRDARDALTEALNRLGES